MKLHHYAAALVAISTVGIGSTAVQAAEEVNIYSYRQPFLIKPFLDEFTKKTGITVNVVFAKKGMMSCCSKPRKRSADSSISPR